MSVSVSRAGAEALIVIDGDVDERGAEEMKSKFRGIALAGLTEVVVDMSHVTHIGSAGIGKLLVFYKDLAVHDARLRVVNVSPEIHALLCEMRLDTIFPIAAAT